MSQIAKFNFPASTSTKYVSTTSSIEPVVLSSGSSNVEVDDADVLNLNDENEANIDIVEDFPEAGVKKKNSFEVTLSPEKDSVSNMLHGTVLKSGKKNISKFGTKSTPSAITDGITTDAVPNSLTKKGLWSNSLDTAQSSPEEIDTSSVSGSQTNEELVADSTEASQSNELIAQSDAVPQSNEELTVESLNGSLNINEISDIPVDDAQSSEEQAVLSVSSSQSTAGSSNQAEGLVPKAKNLKTQTFGKITNAVSLIDTLKLHKVLDTLSSESSYNGEPTEPLMINQNTSGQTKKTINIGSGTKTKHSTISKNTNKVKNRSNIDNLDTLPDTISQINGKTRNESGEFNFPTSPIRIKKNKVLTNNEINSSGSESTVSTDDTIADPLLLVDTLEPQSITIKSKAALPTKDTLKVLPTGKVSNGKTLDSTASPDNEDEPTELEHTELVPTETELEPSNVDPITETTGNTNNVITNPRVKSTQPLITTTALLPKEKIKAPSTDKLNKFGTINGTVSPDDDADPTTSVEPATVHTTNPSTKTLVLTTKTTDTTSPDEWNKFGTIDTTVSPDDEEEPTEVVPDDFFDSTKSTSKKSALTTDKTKATSIKYASKSKTLFKTVSPEDEDDEGTTDVEPVDAFDTTETPTESASTPLSPEVTLQHKADYSQENLKQLSKTVSSSSMNQMSAIFFPLLVCSVFIAYFVVRKRRRKSSFGSSQPNSNLSKDSNKPASSNASYSKLPNNTQDTWDDWQEEAGGGFESGIGIKRQNVKSPISTTTYDIAFNPFMSEDANRDRSSSVSSGSSTEGRFTQDKRHVGNTFSNSNSEHMINIPINDRQLPDNIDIMNSSMHNMYNPFANSSDLFSDMGMVPNVQSKTQQRKSSNPPPSQHTEAAVNVSTDLFAIASDDAHIQDDGWDDEDF